MAEVIDLNNHPFLSVEEGHIKKVLYQSDSYHVWIHADEPGTKGPMHKHTADQTFFCLKGECTFRFPDGSTTLLTPGQMIVIRKGELYQLHNTGDIALVMLGNRGERYENPRFDPAGRKVGG